VTTGRVIVVALGATQTIASASSDYMPAILGGPIASALHLPTSVFFGPFSGALLLSAMVGPSVGRLIDRRRGRHLLATSILVIAAGLLILAAAPSRVSSSPGLRTSRWRWWTVATLPARRDRLAVGNA
jgi:hypothetical protein